MGRLISIANAIASGSAAREQTLTVAELGEISVEEYRACLKALLGGTIPLDGTFYKKMHSVLSCIGFGGPSYECVGRLWAEAYRQVPENERAGFLDDMVSDKRGHDFWLLASSLATFLKVTELPADFAARWFLKLADRVKDDMMAGTAYTGMQEYGHSFPVSAIHVIDNLIQEHVDRFRIGIAGILLGTAKAGAKDEIAKKLTLRAFNRFKRCKDERHIIFMKACANLFQYHKISERQILKMLSGEVASGGDVASEAFGVLLGSWNVRRGNPSYTRAVLDWLRANIQYALTDNAKHAVASLIWLIFTDKANYEPLSSLEDGNFILAGIQPIPLENRRTWMEVTQYLDERLRNDEGEFCKIVTALADANAKGLQTVFSDSHEGGMSGDITEKSSSLFAYLLGSEDGAKRRLAFTLFRASKLKTFEPSAFSAIGKQAMIRILKDAIRQLRMGPDVSRFMVAIEGIVARADADVQRLFVDLAVFEATNFHGACLEVWKDCREKTLLLQKAVAEGEAYFANLEDAEKSGAEVFHFPGYDMACRQASSRMNQQVQDRAREGSIFAMSVANVQLIYGRKWSAAREGRVGGASELTEISHSVELPRIEVVDPEGMLIKRITMA